jgi:DNA-binding IclR family transcriptional regulator
MESVTPRLSLVRRSADQIQALTRGLRVLEYVYAAGRPVGIKELALAVDLNLSTAYHLVNTLLYEGYLVRDEDRMLRPGRPLGSSQLQRSTGVGRALVHAAQATGDVSVLARLLGPQTRITAVAELRDAPSRGHYPQNAAALSHLLAVGRVILAGQPSDEVERLIELTRQAALEQQEVFDEIELRNDLAATAERGYCTIVGNGDGCVAVPVLDSGGQTVAGLAVVVTPRRLRHELDQLVDIGTRTAGELGLPLAPAAPLAPVVPLTPAAPDRAERH